MRVNWSDRARRDLHAIHAHISEDNPRAARRWLTRLRARANAASKLPLAGRVAPEVERADVREVFVGAYRIIYRVRDDELLVLTVFEGHHRLPSAVLTAVDDE